MASMNAEKTAVIIEVARKLRIKDPRWLDAMIMHESGYDPIIQNRGGHRAFGLIQFTPIAATELHNKAPQLGISEPEDVPRLFPTFEAQMRGPVFWYYNLQPKPYISLYEIAAATFYPKYRYSDPNKILDSAKAIAANPGINTVGILRDRLQKLLDSPSLATNKYHDEAYAIAGNPPSGISPLLIAAIAAVGGWMILSHKS